MTKFSLPSAMLEGGRDVRCGKCRHVWFQEPTGEARQAEENLDKAEDMFGVSEIPQSVQPIPSDSSLQILPEDAVAAEARSTQTAFLTFLLLFFISFGVVVTLQNKIISSWPPSALFYETIGLDVSVVGKGLSIDNIISDYREVDTGSILYVEADLTNTLNKEIVYPPLTLILKDNEGDELKRWPIEAPEDEVFKPGETKSVKFGFQAPPEGGTVIKITVPQ